MNDEAMIWCPEKLSWWNMNISTAAILPTDDQSTFKWWRIGHADPSEIVPFHCSFVFLAQWDCSRFKLCWRVKPKYYIFTHITCICETFIFPGKIFKYKTQVCVYVHACVCICEWDRIESWFLRGFILHFGVVLWPSYKWILWSQLLCF